MNLLKIYITFFFLLCLCQIQAQTNEAFITKETSFKSEGSFSSKTISRIFADDKVILLNDCNYFYCKVDFNGRIGWVKKLLIVVRNPPEKQMQTDQVDTVEQNEINFQYAADVIIPSEKKLQTDQVDSLEQDETNFQYAKEEFISKGSDTEKSIDDTEKLNWDYENSLSVNNTSNSFLILLYGIIILGGLLICRLGYFNYKLLFKNKKVETIIRDLNVKYQGIINIDDELNKRKIEVNEVMRSRDELRSKYHSENDIYEKLIIETNLLKNEIEVAEFGVYEPLFGEEFSEKFKLKIKEIQEKQKMVITNGKAIVECVDWKVNGTIAEGEKMISVQKKLMLRAFNAECNNFIKSVKWNNEIQMEEQILNAAKTINKIGETQGLEISSRYSFLKILELKSTHEYVLREHKRKGIQIRSKKIGES